MIYESPTSAGRGANAIFHIKRDATTDPVAFRNLKAAAPAREWFTEVGPKEVRADGKISQLVVSVPPDLRLGGQLDCMQTIDVDPFDGYDLAALPVRSTDMLKFAEQYRKFVDAKIDSRAERRRK